MVGPAQPAPCLSLPCQSTSRQSFVRHEDSADPPAPRQAVPPPTAAVVKNHYSIV